MADDFIRRNFNFSVQFRRRICRNLNFPARFQRQFYSNESFCAFLNIKMNRRKENSKRRLGSINSSIRSPCPEATWTISMQKRVSSSVVSISVYGRGIFLAGRADVDYRRRMVASLTRVCNLLRISYVRFFLFFVVQSNIQTRTNVTISVLFAR